MPEIRSIFWQKSLMFAEVLNLFFYPFASKLEPATKWYYDRCTQKHSF